MKLFNKGMAVQTLVTYIFILIAVLFFIFLIWKMGGHSDKFVTSFGNWF